MIGNVIMPDFNPKGLIKVEFFDELTGRKMEEVNTHNFIAKGVLDTIFKAKMRDVFTEKRVTGGTLISNWFEDAFAQISLTTVDHPESPESEWLREGELIGYAYSDAVYSGTDILRGGYNAAESFTKPDHVRMVFDFPTHAAVGTFESVYFHPKAAAYKVPNVVDPKLAGLTSIQKYNEKYYLLKAGKMEVYGADWILIDTFTIPSGTNLRDFCIVNDTIYYIRSSVTNTIIKADLSNPADTVLVKNLTSPFCGGIYFDDEKQQFVVGDYPSSVNKLEYFDANFEIKTNEIILDIVNSNSTGVINKDGDNFIIGYHVVDKSNNVCQITTSTIAVRGIIDNTLYVTNYALPKTFIGSRSLLDTPITKTDKQAMKITYDFVLPPMY